VFQYFGSFKNELLSTHFGRYELFGKAFHNRIRSNVMGSRNNLIWKIVKKVYNFSGKLGIDPLPVWSFIRFGKRYIRDYLKFQKEGGVITDRYPILVDMLDEAGVANGHYFHQDLLVASRIFKANPRKHIDVGSSINGFVAHVASFRKISIFDIRPLKIDAHQNIEFTQIDFQNGSDLPTEICDSISCLHAIEHFGLGRYGDPIDPLGHIKGLNNLYSLLEPGGTLYISCPIGSSNQVHFNAHRVFEPTGILNWAPNLGLDLIRFNYVDDFGDLHQGLPSETPNLEFGLGIYEFRKSAK
jgi:hypothetical protein